MPACNAMPCKYVYPVMCSAGSLQRQYTEYRGSILSRVEVSWHECMAEESPEQGAIQPSPAQAAQLSPTAPPGTREFYVHSEHSMCGQGGDLAVEQSLS